MSLEELTLLEIQMKGICMTLLATMKKQPQVPINKTHNFGDFQLVENSDGSITKIFPKFKITVDNTRRSETVEDLKTGITSYTEWDKEGKMVVSSAEHVKDGKKFKIITQYNAGEFWSEERFENGRKVYTRDKFGIRILTKDGQWKIVSHLHEKENEK